ncbi:mechanosensitive ion channel family protein [Patescibacteria group bacterium]|nr:mechanosensitive ion channel family protein [Patescibacteria group bacterium]
MADLNTFLQLSFAGNTMGAYIMALLFFIGVYLLLQLFRKQILNRVKIIAEKTKNDFDDLLIAILQSVGSPFYLLLATAAALQFIQEPEFARSVGYWIAFVVIVYSVIKALSRVIDYFFEKIIKKRLEEGGTFDPSIIKLLKKVLKGILWVVALLLVVQNLGYDITALIAGLGIGGIAIAFALQGILSDIFASFSIYFDKPFQTGDFIIVGDEMGTIKHIGLKSTRIQTLQGEELVMSNKELTEARIHNYKTMERRRIGFRFGVVYDTPTKKLRQIPEMVKDIVAAQELADVDRVHFTEFGDFSLNFQVMYYINIPDYTAYMDTQQAINLAIKEKFEQEGIEFAYPTQTLYVKK